MVVQQLGISDRRLLQQILKGKISIREINLGNNDYFATAIDALNIKPTLAKDLDLKFVDQKNLIIAWLQCPNPYYSGAYANSGYTALNLHRAAKMAFIGEDKIFGETTHDNDIIRTYLGMIIRNVDSVNDVRVYQSFKNEINMKIDFKTRKGEEIVYRDKELNIPVYMLADLSLTLKISDPYAFVKYVDVNVDRINVGLLKAKFNPLISTALRQAMAKTIVEKELCYYDLSSNYGVIANVMKDELQAFFSNSGIEVCDVFIRGTSIPNGAEKIFERQRIEFMQKEKELDLQHRAEKMSLENYEKKAEIHNKYPEMEFTLTEKEKDNALNRFLIKKEKMEEPAPLETVSEVVVEERPEEVPVVEEAKEEVKEKPVRIKKHRTTRKVLGCIFAALAVWVAALVVMNFTGLRDSVNETKYTLIGGGFSALSWILIITAIVVGIKGRKKKQQQIIIPEAPVDEEIEPISEPVVEEEVNPVEEVKANEEAKPAEVVEEVAVTAPEQK